MGIRSQNNPAANYLDKWTRTGTDAMLWTEPSGLKASGGMISDYTGPSGKVWRCHVFTSSGTLDITDSGVYGNYMEFFCLAGGGGGAGADAPSPSNGGRGGGGAGGLRRNYAGPDSDGSGGPTWVAGQMPDTCFEYPGSGNVSYTITVGAGGRGRMEGTGFRGGDSSIVHPTLNSGTGIVATGGGAGAGSPWNPAGSPSSNVPGGCGGGAAYDNNYGDTLASPDGIAPTVQGTVGGPGDSPQPGGGGGGGASAAGQNSGSPHGGGDGGAGAFCHMAGNAPPTVGGLNSGIFYWASNLPHAGTGAFGGGGGGGGGYPGGSGTDGGNPSWSGGHGADPGSATDGQPTTGAGGGGGTGHIVDDSGSGGSGCVLIRYQIAAHNTGTARATGGQVSFYGGKTIHVFAASGRFATPLTMNPGGSDITDAEVICIGGGGGGGWDRAGSGGGASYVHATGVTIPHATGYGHGITVGAGGRGGVPDAPDNSGGTGAGRWGSGSGCYWPNNIIGNGGGGGGAISSPQPSTAGSPGGSGGGGGASTPGQGGDAAAPPSSPSSALTSDTGGRSYQTAGGDGNPAPSSLAAGSGGGAGGAGNDGGAPRDGVAGGVGMQLPATFQNPAVVLGYPGPSSSLWWVCGGGGSGATDNATGGGGGGGPNPAPYSGAGRGGNSPAPNAFLPAMDAKVGSGSGGGGGGNNPNSALSARGGRGGSGLVLIAYPS